MPELPEVETVKNELSVVVGGKILSVTNSGKKFRHLMPEGSELIGKNILKIGRRAKYLIFYFSDNHFAISHLGMTGSFYWTEKEKYVPEKHYHLNLQIKKDNKIYYLSYKDPRRFGYFDLGVGDPQQHAKLSILGPEPEDLIVKYLKEQLNNQKIKSFLLDQNNIAGIGNIYADEILFASNVLPTRIAHSLSDEEVIKIVKNTQSIIQKAIENKGSTILSYSSLNGAKGGNQNYLKVYGKAKQPCVVCGVNLVSSKVGGRTSTYCLNCQK